MEGKGRIHPARYGRDRRRHLAALLLIGGLTILLLALAPAAGAGPRTIIWDWLATPAWTSITDPITGVGASGDTATSVLMAKGDVIFVAGERDNAGGTSDISLVKYKAGVKLWTADYNGPGNNDDWTARMALSPDGKYVYVTGSAANASGNRDLVVVKFSAKTGGVKWAKRHDGPAHMNDAGLFVGVDGYGNVIAVGYVSTPTAQDMAVVSWSSSGAKRWVWRHSSGAGSTEIPEGMLVLPDGSTYAAGFAATATSQAAVTARLSSWGRKLWLKKYLGPGGLGAQATCLAPRPGGGVYVGGLVVTGATGTDAAVFRYTPKGKRTDFALDTAGGGATTEIPLDIAVTSTKHVVIVGFTGSMADTDGRVVVYRPDGSIFGALSLPGVWSDALWGVAADKLGGYYVTGSHHVAAADCKILTIRGSVLAGGGGWYSQWGPVVSGNNQPEAIAVRGTTACVVGRYDSGGATGIDQAVLTYVY